MFPFFQTPKEEGTTQSDGHREDWVGSMFCVVCCGEFLMGRLDEHHIM